MSTYNGNDIFGSGGHRIVPGGLIVSKKRTSYAGVDGRESLIIGARGRQIIITGQLRAATAAALETLIGIIEDEITLGAADLVDNWGATYSNVELDRIDVNRPFLVTKEGTYIINYTVEATQLIT